MQAFKILGGRKLKGEVKPQGAKNEALQIICATLLTSDEVVINNIPDIIDINKVKSFPAVINKEQKSKEIHENSKTLHYQSRCTISKK